jgi:hypothetical protein
VANDPAPIFRTSAVAPLEPSIFPSSHSSPSSTFPSPHTPISCVDASLASSVVDDSPPVDDSPMLTSFRGEQEAMVSTTQKNPRTLEVIIHPT